MNPHMIKSKDPQVTSRFSIASEVVLQVIVVVIPVVAFMLMGLIAHGLDKSGKSSPYLFAAIVVLQTVGIAAMAFAILVRFKNAFGQLRALTSPHPPAWRRLALMLSIACVLLTDLCANLAVAFDGAGFLFVAGVPMFFIALVCHGVAFAGLSRRRNGAE